jgi:hypothetical protein
MDERDIKQQTPGPRYLDHVYVGTELIWPLRLLLPHESD